MVQRYKKSARYAREIANNLVKGRIMRNKAVKGVWKDKNACTFSGNFVNLQMNSGEKVR